MRDFELANRRGGAPLRAGFLLVFRKPQESCTGLRLQRETAPAIFRCFTKCAQWFEPRQHQVKPPENISGQRGIAAPVHQSRPHVVAAIDLLKGVEKKLKLRIPPRAHSRLGNAIGDGMFPRRRARGSYRRKFDADSRTHVNSPRQVGYSLHASVNALVEVDLENKALKTIKFFGSRAQLGKLVLVVGLEREPRGMVEWLA
jgi:hypothetical protein